jgi:hypothetical protein
MGKPRTLFVVGGLAYCLLLASTGARAEPVKPPALASYDWSISATPNLAAKPPPKQVIQAFLTKLYPRWAGLYKPSEYDSFAFADLRQSGTLSLVAALAPGGPGGCGATVIVDKEGQKFDRARIQCTGSPIKIGGKTVVESYQELTRSWGMGERTCSTKFPIIYGWNGSAYVDMSDQFPGYYRKALQHLQDEIANPSASLSSYQKRHLNLDSATSPVGCDKIEADAIERFLGSPDAGIEDAIRWSQSSNQIDRLEAIQLFFNLGTPRALDYLKAMTSDSDPEVARAAEGTLDALNSGAHEDPLAKVGHFKVDTGP